MLKYFFSLSPYTTENSLSAPNVTKPTTSSTGEITLAGEKKIKYLKKKPSKCHFVHHKVTMTGLESNLGLHGEWQAKHNI